MRVLFIFLIFISAGSAMADEFGQRFGNEPPFALRDTLDPTTVFNIHTVEPAAGEEETLVPAEEEKDAGNAEENAETEPEEATDAALEKTEEAGTVAGESASQTGITVDAGVDVEETTQQEEETPVSPGSNGLVRIYPEPVKK